MYILFYPLAKVLEKNQAIKMRESIICHIATMIKTQNVFKDNKNCQKLLDDAYTESLLQVNDEQGFSSFDP